MSEVLFSSVAYRSFNPKGTLPAKFKRLLEASNINNSVQDKNVAVKMHLGRGIGYTTISPLFVKILIDWLKSCGARPFITDQTVEDAKSRGYSEDLFGVPILDVCGLFNKYVYPYDVNLKSFKNVDIAGYIHDADYLINLSHVKGHGSCGYGGACKNIAMGCVTDRTRAQIHSLEGGISWDKSLCNHCKECLSACNHKANSFNGEEYEIFYHNCTFCQHCIKVCPSGALTLDKENSYHDFQNGMALCTKTVLDRFAPEQIFHINFLTNITLLCDCWGLSTPSLVPDIGIMASHDIVSLEYACLDSIRLENLLKTGLPEGFELSVGDHLLERIHRRNPYVQLEYLESRGLGEPNFSIKEIV